MVEVRQNSNSIDFVIGGEARRSKRVFVQDAGRSGDIVFGTVVSADPAANKLQPISVLNDTDGKSIPVGILTEKITEAAIKAGDVSAYVVFGFGAVQLDENQIVLEYTGTLDSEVTEINLTMRQSLASIAGVHLSAGKNTSDYEV